MKSFRELDIKLRYKSTDEHKPIHFYEEVFPSCKQVNLFLGYFATGAIRELSLCVSQLIGNEGTIRIITNEEWNIEDRKNLIEDDHNLVSDKDFYGIMKDPIALSDELSKYGQHFYDCLKYLKKHNKLKIQPVKFRSGNQHTKFSILSDGKDLISTDGSQNFSKQGLLYNGERFSVFKEWEENEERKKNIAEDLEEIEQVFNQTHPDYIYLDSTKIDEFIEQKGRDKSKQDLRQNSEKLKQEWYKKIEKQRKEKRLILNQKKIDQIRRKKEPHFPPPHSPYPYQTEAYEKWLKNDKKGLFAMATGTGKTITALNAILEGYKKNKFYRFVVLVPTDALVNQWEQDCKNFNFKNIILSSQNDWKKRIEDEVIYSKIDKERSFVLISTYASFLTSKTQKLREKLDNPLLTIVVDEAHGIGTKQKLSCLPRNIKNRIGLSATPKRKYDQTGSQSIEEYFNAYPPGYTFSYSMLKAIKDGRLSKYKYYPVFVTLNEEELEKYIELSKQIVKHYDSKENKFTEKGKQLLILRAFIIKTAKNKLPETKKTLTKLLQKNKKVEHTIVFVPFGYDNNQEDEESSHRIDMYTKMIASLNIPVRKFGKSGREKIIQQFRSRDLGVLTAMKTLDEGVDIPEIKRAIFCASSGVEREYIQRRGRILRKHNNKTAEVYDIIVEPNRSWDHVEYAKAKQMEQMENNVLRKEMDRVINFLYACDNIEDLHLAKNSNTPELEGFKKLIKYCDNLKINIFDEINILREIDLPKKQPQ